MPAGLALILAIIAEVIATSALKLSAGFTRWLPGGVAVLGYVIAFYLLSMTLRAIPVGIAYAIWSGAGTVLITVIGVLAFRQKLDAPGILGIGLIIAGVLVLNLWSKSGGHA